MIKTFRPRYGICLLFLLSVLLMGGTASAVTYDLCTGQAEMTMPDAQPLTVWGLGLDPTGTGVCAVTVPGPPLRVSWDDPGLTINLRNTLAEPVSLHILGQMLSNNAGPVWDDGTSGPRPDSADPVLRVRSFTHEAAGDGGTASYQWDAITPGTYMVQSATNPAKQVQMGISALVIKDAALGVAYADNPSVGGDQSVPYDKELILVFQEFDPEIHAAVAAGDYGPGGTITSSVYREPRYFLINGMGHPDTGLDPVNAGGPVNLGERLLIRFANAGAVTHMPQMLGDYFTVVAQDGIPYKYPVENYSVELNSAKTIDAIYQPMVGGRLPILDGRLRLSNAGASPGGMLAYLNVAGGDMVTIQSVTYNSGSLTVVATSSAQPGAFLTAEGHGLLSWKGAQGFYRTTFTGLTSQPASVTVTSSMGGTDTYVFPGPDTVTIPSVVYDATNGGTLTVVATSSDQPNVLLTAEGLGALGWKSTKNFYRNTFTGIGAQPASVTVTSSGGGTDTYVFPGPDTVTIPSVVYDAANGGTLTVVATSSDQPNVLLTAEGLGALGWKSTKNFYRNTFTGIGAQPASVTVTSSGGGTAEFILP